MPPSSASFRALIWMVVPGGGDSYSDGAWAFRRRRRVLCCCSADALHILSHIYIFPRRGQDTSNSLSLSPLISDRPSGGSGSGKIGQRQHQPAGDGNGREDQGVLSPSVTETMDYLELIHSFQRMPLPSIRSSNTQDVAASPWRVPAASDAAVHDLHVLGGLLACTSFSDSQWMKNNDLFPYGRCKDLIYILLYVLLGVGNLPDALSVPFLVGITIDVAWNISTSRKDFVFSGSL